MVFDFGSELYIWQGKQTSSKERQIAAKLAQIVWERGYDYREFDSNPIWPGQSKKPTHGTARPDWALFGKVCFGFGFLNSFKVCILTHFT